MKPSSFFGRLARRAQATGSLLCVGLDPHPDDLPTPTAAAALAFCRDIVTATRPYACAFKPNVAFFEAFGAEGVAALTTLVREIEPEIPVVLDAKRGDIASTAAAYATACFSQVGASSVTIHPYLGEDSAAPLLQDRDRGVFVLCRTSNPGAAEFQEGCDASGRPLYVRVAAAVRTWGGAKAGDADDDLRCGLVVGATVADAMAAVRRVNPEAWILAPGVGAQGGDLEATVAGAVRDDGLGLLLSVSRGISWQTDRGAAAAAFVARVNRARAAAIVTRSAATGFTATGSTALRTPAGRRLADGLLSSGCVRFGSFTLKSGLTSPIYLDLRRLSGAPALMRLAADAYAKLLRQLSFDRLAALPYAGLPIGTAVALAGDWPLCYPRKSRKAHGMGAAIEGPFAAGDVVAVIDDLATRGTSALEALPILRAAELTVRDLVVLVDRSSGAGPRLATAGVQLHAVYTLQELLAYWRETDAISRANFDAVRIFLAETAAQSDRTTPQER